MHDHNIIHADIKLANILVKKPPKAERANGVPSRAILCDFGISQQMGKCND